MFEILFLLSPFAIIAWFVVSLVFVIRTRKEKSDAKYFSILSLILSSVALAVVILAVVVLILALAGAISLM